MKYSMLDGTMIDTSRAVARWDLWPRTDGARAFLLKSRRGRYYMEYVSHTPGLESRAEWVSEQEAARRLTLAGLPLPADLAGIGEQLTE